MKAKGMFMGDDANESKVQNKSETPLLKELKRKKKAKKKGMFSK